MNTYILRFIKCFLIFLISFFPYKMIYADEIAFVPNLINYNTNDYDAGNQNWSISQGYDGVMYIGNNSGLLTFDAVNWKLYKLPNNLSVKSVFINIHSPEEIIFVGSYEEFGYFKKDSFNELIYYSLKEKVKDHEFNNEEVWTITQKDNKVLFQTFSNVFVYNLNDKTIEVHATSPSPLYFFNVNNNIYAQLRRDHFYIYEDNKFKIVLNRELLGDDDVISVEVFKNKLLLITSKNGLFFFNEKTNVLEKFYTQIDSAFSDTPVNRTLCLNDSTLILGTLNDGIYAINHSGELLWHLHHENGLYNNTVLGLNKDHHNNIWATLDNGISYIHVNSPFSLFEPKEGFIGMVEDILVTDNKYYIATNQGVYSNVDNSKEIRHLSEFNEQTWFVRQFGNQIITGNNIGTSFIQGTSNKTVIKSGSGGMDIKQMQINDEDILLESTYNDLQIFKKDDNDKWTYSNRISNFSDLIYQLEADNYGNIWANHMYKGVYKLRLNEELNDITHKEFYTSLDEKHNVAANSQPIRTMKLRGRIVFTNGEKFYTYDDINKSIIPYEQLNYDIPLLSDSKSITSVNDTLFWFLRLYEFSLVKFSHNKFSVIDKIPFSRLNNPPNTGRGNIFVDKENGITYFCLNGGIGKYLNKEIRSQDKITLSLNKISHLNRKTNRVEKIIPNNNIYLSHIFNNITFEFQYTDFQNDFIVQCLLEGYDLDWTNTTTQLQKNYSNLEPYDYNLKARVVNKTGEIVDELSIPFRIKKPWYKTVVAVIIYVLLFILTIYFFIKVNINRAVSKEQKAFEVLEKERLAQLSKQEKMIVEMKNEELQAELTYKSKELANSSLMVINHEELLNDLKERIQEGIISGKINHQSGKVLVSLINDNLSNDNEWVHFQENFDLIHNNFFANLTALYPSLTSNDLKICALLRLNYSSKDISKMLNISIRGVETARYRLRKKLQLDKGESLTSYIINFK